MEYYAIQECNTGDMMPERKKSDRGFTSIDFSTMTERPPRLFIQLTAAKNALRWYLHGPAKLEWHTDYTDEFSGDTGYSSVGYGDVPRDPNNYRIVVMDVYITRVYKEKK
jgi:hypothetical protein